MINFKSVCLIALSDHLAMVEIRSCLFPQVTGALRNLADVTGAKEIFLSSGVIRNLSIVLGPYLSDNDVVWNVCRALR